MKRFLASVLFVAMVVVAPNANGQEATPSFDGDTKVLTIDLTASGLRTAVKLDDMTCQFGFPGLVVDPFILVLNPEQEVVSTTPLGTGDWSKPDDVALCEQTYQVEVPLSGAFVIEIAPYFVDDVTDKDIAGGSLAIDLNREMNDPFPISPIPAGGPIEGSGDVRIVGKLELSGEEFSDFMISPFGCAGMGGYRDIQVGMQITGKDETGTIVGVTELIPDPVQDMPEDCTFLFIVEVPVSTFYTFESGRRGSMTYSHDDLEGYGWSIHLTIGD